MAVVRDFLATLATQLTSGRPCSVTIETKHFDFDLVANSSESTGKERQEAQEGEGDDTRRLDTGVQNGPNAFKAMLPLRNVTELWKLDLLGLLCAVHVRSHMRFRLLESVRTLLAEPEPAILIRGSSVKNRSKQCAEEEERKGVGKWVRPRCRNVGHRMDSISPGASTLHRGVAIMVIVYSIFS